LASHLEPARAEQAIGALAGFRQTYVFDSVELMEQDLELPTHPWRGVGDFRFSPRHVTGRGGRELEFVLSDEPDPAVRRFFDETWGAYLDETYGETSVFSFSLSCLEHRRPLGVALGYVVGDTWDLERLVVSAERRGEGIGGALLSQLERVAIDRGGARIRLRTNADGRARKLYADHGYAVTATLENWRGDRAFVAMERRLTPYSSIS
jgi:GNAT superfamily N-acetyltransferase